MSEMRDMLLDQATRLFGDLIDRDLLAAAERGEPSTTLAEAIAAFGLADALTVPPDEGGLSFADAGALFVLFGHFAVPLPLGETMLARALLARAGIEAPGGAIGLVDGDAGASSLRHADRLDHVVVGRQGRLQLVAVAKAATWQTGMARLPRAVVDIDAGTAVADAAWPDPLPGARMLGAMLRASEMGGALGRVLAMSVEYANTRHQFGRPIGRFQAVQQLLAKLAAEAAAAQSAADFAWASLDAGALGHAGLIAKIRTGEAARIGAAIAHQVHGAIGVTDEHMLHYFTRRLWEDRLDFGSDGYWAERLGRHLRESKADLWTELTTRCGTPAAAKASV